MDIISTFKSPHFNSMLLSTFNFINNISKYTTVLVNVHSNMHFISFKNPQRKEKNSSFYLLYFYHSLLFNYHVFRTLPNWYVFKMWHPDLFTSKQLIEKIKKDTLRTFFLVIMKLIWRGFKNRNNILTKKVNCWWKMDWTALNQIFLFERENVYMKFWFYFLFYVSWFYFVYWFTVRDFSAFSWLDSILDRFVQKSGWWFFLWYL